MVNKEEIQSGFKWLAFALAVYFFTAIFSGIVPIIAVFIGLIGVYKLRRVSEKSVMLGSSSLAVFVYYILLSDRDIHLWFIEKPSIFELTVGNALIILFLYALLEFIVDVAATETDQLLVKERRSVIFMLTFLTMFVQSFVLTSSYLVALYMFLLCILLTAANLALVIHLIVRISSHIEDIHQEVRLEKIVKKIPFLVILMCVHIILTIYAFFIFKRYEFVDPLQSIFIANIVGLLFFTFNYYVFEQFMKESVKKAMPAMHVILLIVFIEMAIRFLPSYTYEDAVKIVENTLNVEIEEPMKGESKRRLSEYLLYTEDMMIIFNTERGDFAMTNRGSKWE